jgi:hypothetical protein
VVKIDVEGSGIRVLRGAVHLLRERKPAVLLATHGSDLHARCCSLLHSLGYELRGLGDAPVQDTDELIAEPAS